MKKFNWFAFILLSIITLGIYGIYAMHHMTKNQNQIAAAYGVKSITPYVTAWLLGLVTCGIYTVVWVYIFINQQVAIARVQGIECTPSNNPLIAYIVYCVFGPLGDFIICENHNNIVDTFSQQQQAYQQYQQQYQGYQQQYQGYQQQYQGYQQQYQGYQQAPNQNNQQF